MRFYFTCSLVLCLLCGCRQNVGKRGMNSNITLSEMEKISNEYSSKRSEKYIGPDFDFLKESLVEFQNADSLLQNSMKKINDFNFQFNHGYIEQKDSLAFYDTHVKKKIETNQYKVIYAQHSPEMSKEFYFLARSLDRKFECWRVPGSYHFDKKEKFVKVIEDKIKIGEKNIEMAKQHLSKFKSESIPAQKAISSYANLIESWKKKLIHFKERESVFTESK